MSISGFSAEQRIQYIFNSLNKSEPSYISSIVNLLETDPSPIVRHEAAYILGEINSDQSINALIAAINNDNNRFVIHESLLALSNLGIESTTNIIELKLNHSDQDVSATAIIAKQRLNMKLNCETVNLKEARTLIIDHESIEEERIQSAFRLLSDGSNDSIKLLVDALFEEINPIVKHEIVFCLGEVASKVACDALLKILNQELNDFVLHETLLALSTLGYIAAKPYIESYLNSPIAEISESAEIALERLVTL